MAATFSTSDPPGFSTLFISASAAVSTSFGSA